MDGEDVLRHQETLIRSLGPVLIPTLNSTAPAPQVFETHISWIVLAGSHAYKFKKAVHLDFLDFSTLEARRFYCQEEVRLNRRLAPDLYLGVVAITGTPTSPVVDGAGPAIEYAVKMRAFAQEALWSDRIEKGRLCAAEIDDLAHTVAHFHASVAKAPETSPWGSADTLADVLNESLSLICSQASSLACSPTSTLSKTAESTEELSAWQIRQQQQLRDTFEQRKAQGFIRECHGDLHSGNILTIDNRVTVFDCIEFSEKLRWIDVMNDLAFITMDLQFHGLPMLAARLLNGYLEITGDYDGLATLRYYQTERALVRCKVALLRKQQLEAQASGNTAAVAMQAESYMAFALRSIQPAKPAIIIMHGYSGSGKSTFSACLLEALAAVRIRSDVERKRMRGIAPGSAQKAAPGAGLYDEETTRATYETLLTLARKIATSGLPVIVDAAFLRRAQRAAFEALAAELRIPFFIIDILASEAMMRSRVAARAQTSVDPSDAGLEVLAHQLAHHDALSVEEGKHVLRIDSEAAPGIGDVPKACERVMTRLRDAGLQCLRS